MGGWGKTAKTYGGRIEGGSEELGGGRTPTPQKELLFRTPQRTDASGCQEESPTWTVERESVLLNFLSGEGR